MNLVQFKKNVEAPSGSIIYHIKFSDGFESHITPELLRDNCPCAGCKGEEVLLHKYVPANNSPVTAEGYIIEKADMVGNYAIQFSWKDGHNTGIYTWEHLKKICNNQLEKKV